MEKRVCRKCLLAEIDNEKLLVDVQTAIKRLGKDMRVDENLYQKRLQHCRECDYLSDGTCGACGCYVELRAAARTGKCPYKKW